MLADAQIYHKKGLSLLWLKPGTKQPFSNNWSKAPHKTWDELKKSFIKDANVGVRLGHKLPDGSYISVIDCDLKSDQEEHLDQLHEKLAELVSEDDQKVICVSGRGNGSMHVYIRTEKPTTPARFAQSPERVKLSMPSASKPSRDEEANLSEKEIKAGIRIRPAWEISIMGLGQQTVLPPSVHPDSGLKYQWLGDDVPDFSKLPLVTLPEMHKKAGGKVTVTDRHVFPTVLLMDTALSDEMIALITKGEGCEDRSASLFKAAMSMTRARMTRDEILSVLTDQKHYLGHAGYEHAKTTSRAKAARWIEKYTLNRAEKTASAAGDFDEKFEEPILLSEEEAETQVVEATERHWTVRLERFDSSGALKPSLRNTWLIMTNVGGADCIRYDDFAKRESYACDTPWGGIKGHELRDVDTVKIKHWISFKWGIEPDDRKIEQAVMKIADSNRFHPVRDYLNSLEWDGVKRIDTWLQEYLSAHDAPQEYLSAVGRKLLLAMVARIFRPGIKFDQVTILEGEQGTRKSSAVALLAHPWGSDAAIRVGDKDTIMNMQSKWVIELGELSAMRRADVETLKEFISQGTDRIRAPYGRRSEEYPRQCIFIGTTNRSDYLKDRTGNRRYWPVKVGKIRYEALEEIRDQLLAEASWEWHIGDEPLYMGTELLQDQAALVQKSKLEIDAWTDIVLRVIGDNETPLPDPFSMTELAEHPLAEGLSIKSRADQMRVADVLRDCGFERVRSMIGAVRAWRWAKKVEDIKVVPHEKW